MKILVTGGAGFIGSHVVNKYIEMGHEVVVVDNLASGKMSNLNPRAKFYLMDVCSGDLERVFEIEQPDVVNHHAAQKSIPKSVQDPMHDAQINVLGLLNLLELSSKYAVKKVIYISSGGALAGDAEIIPTPESYPPVMISPYAISKYIGEKYLHYYNVLHGLCYTVLRYANVYGPRQVPEGECGVLPIFLNNAIKDQPSTLYTYSDMPKGTTRDYVYIEDICEANLLVLDKGDNEIYNIGSGEEVYIGDLYNQMLEVVGRSQPLFKQSERVGDVRRSALDISKAKEQLGWKPKVGFDAGIHRTYQYYLD